MSQVVDGMGIRDRLWWRGDEVEGQMIPRPWQRFNIGPSKLGGNWVSRETSFHAGLHNDAGLGRTLAAVSLRAVKVRWWLRCGLGEDNPFIETGYRFAISRLGL